MKTKSQIEIVGATVLISIGTDRVFLDTNLPCPYPACISTDPLNLGFDVTKGKGIQYVKDNFGIEPKVIDTVSRSNRE